MPDSMTRKREVRKCKWQCENSFSAEESYHGTMSGTKRHANRKAEELEKLCNARTRPRPEKASPSLKKCKNLNSSSRGERKGEKKGCDGFEEKETKLD
ncbi:unnamed protein product [Prunus armeniaca]|uniref:Uncharacterized protein n=1 Tax=Prunus armeniaca TaxID=36596 RepID=A0A6J5TUR2_PRUAR|nr:unnamed protein product [Prunus armeniaca]